MPEDVGHLGHSLPLSFSLSPTPPSLRLLISSSFQPIRPSNPTSYSAIMTVLYEGGGTNAIAVMDELSRAAEQAGAHEEIQQGQDRGDGRGHVGHGRRVQHAGDFAVLLLGDQTVHDQRVAGPSTGVELDR